MIEEKYPIKDQPDETDFYLSQLNRAKIDKSPQKPEDEDLYEFKDVDQKEIKKGIKRRWFQSKNFTLIVWYDMQNQIKGFQLCYGKNGSDKAITYFDDNELSHREIDYGKNSNLTAILDKDAGKVDPTIFEKFYGAAKVVPEQIVSFIKEREKRILKKQES